MEIIGRFPVVCLDEPGDASSAAVERPTAAARAESAPRRSRRFSGGSGTASPVPFPVRSLAALTVLTALVWVLAFRNDAARRHAAESAAATTIASEPRESVAK